MVLSVPGLKCLLTGQVVKVGVGLVGKAMGGEPACRGQTQVTAVPRIYTIPTRPVSNQPHTMLGNKQNYWPASNCTSKQDCVRNVVFRKVA